MANVPIVNYGQQATLAVSIIFGLFALVAITLRIIARRMAHRRLDLSDYCAVLASVTAAAIMAMNVVIIVNEGMAYGMAAQIAADFGPDTLINLYKLLIPNQILYAVSLTFSKNSILLLYLNLFTERKIVLFTKAMLAFNSAWLVTILFAGSFICRPYSMNWESTPGGRCGNRALLMLFGGAITLTTDVIVVVLPLHSIAKLQMQRYKKFVLLAVFSLGFVTCIFNAARLSVVSKLDMADTYRSLPVVNLLSGLETTLASILGCVPLLRPLFGRERRTLAASHATSGRDASGRSYNRKRPTGLASRPGLDAFALSSTAAKSRTKRSASPAVDRVLASYEVGIDADSMKSDEDKSDEDTKHIMVQQEWTVTLEPIGR